MRRHALLIGLCAAAALLVLAPAAGAKTVELHSFASSFDGSDVNGGAPFEELEKVAVDSSNGDVIVAGGSSIYKFDPSGASTPFSSLAPATAISPGIGFNFAGGMAVDNSGGSTQGRIYAFSEASSMRAYEPSGEAPTTGFPVATVGDDCGVAVDANGNIWRQTYGNAIFEYRPDGTATGQEVKVEGPRGFCAFAMDAQGNFYAPSGYTGGAVSKFGPDGTFLEQVSANGKDVAIDRSTDDIYVDNGSSIEHISPSGELIEEFGNFSDSRGVAVDPDTHAVYALDNGSPASVQMFTSSGQAIVATATTEPPTELGRTEAEVAGKLNPEGVATTDCRFEYGAFYQGFPESVPCTEGNVFSGSSETAVTGTITGLEPETEYHYRLKVTNANGPSYGAARIFKTYGAVKATETGEATVIDATHAELHGKLDPDGLDTHYWFEYGTDFFIEEAAPLPAPPGADAGSTPGVQEVSVTIAGLEAGTSAEGQEYLYRIRAENETGHTFGEILTFHMPPHVNGVTTLAATEPTLTSATFNGSFEPDGKATQYHFEYGATASYGHETATESGGSGSEVKSVSAHVTGLEAGATVHYRVATENADGITYGADKTIRLGEAPRISGDRATEINTDTAVLEATINPDGRATTYHWEYGSEDCASSACTQSPALSIPSGIAGVRVNLPLQGLTPGATYHFRLIASNPLGETTGEDHSFITYSPESGIDDCPNVLARKQTGAAATRHCRAYELVSAPDTGGYDVESNLIHGLHPMPGFPDADGKVLYTVRYGAVPGSGNPTNKGGDPYLATRGKTGWTTEYVGFQANGTPSTVPFASTLLEADPQLDSFAFGGPELCSPCFADGSRNIPLRVGAGPIEKGMAGDENPAAEPAGEIAKAFSADGSHLVFGSTERFEPAGNQGSLSIYERDLTGGGTEVVSTTPSGTTMPGPGTAELDISADGSRVLIGREVGTDAGGNPLYDLYMHFAGSPESVKVAETGSGVLYSGMSADGSKVYFTTVDQLADDTDAGADLFRADVDSSGADVTRVSTGSGGAGNSNGCDPVASSDGEHWNMAGISSAATCGVLAIAGGGGVAADSGAVYFLSPEQLDGSKGTANEPNLYVAAPGSSPEFVATLDPDNRVVDDALFDAPERETADFQVTPDGRYAAFGNQTALVAGSTTAGHAEIYRSEVGGDLACVSCLPSNGAPTSNTSLTRYGLNLVDDGRVFFTSSEQLVLRDTNQLEDAYEWDEGTTALISTGLDTNDSGLLTASADGRDVFFFTRQTLAPQDENGGAMKIYDAREEGGFLYNPPPRPCVASDECHGAGTQQAPPPAINTIEGNGRQQKQPPKPKRCHKGTVKRHGRCVKAHRIHKKRRHHSGGKERHHG